MKRVKKNILPYFETKRGKQRLLRTIRKFIFPWISKNLDKDYVELEVGTNEIPYTRNHDGKAIFGIDLPLEDVE